MRPQGTASPIDATADRVSVPPGGGVWGGRLGRGEVGGHRLEPHRAAPARRVVTQGRQTKKAADGKRPLTSVGDTGIEPVTSSV